MKKEDEEYSFEFQPVYEPGDWITEEDLAGLNMPENDSHFEEENDTQ